MTSPRRLVRIKTSGYTLSPLPVSPTQIEHTSRPEFEFSKFISENPNLSFFKDDTLSPLPVSPTQIEDTSRPEFDFSKFISENPNLSFFKDDTLSPLPVSPTQIEDTSRPEFDFSKFISENPNLSFFKDDTLSPLPVSPTQIEDTSRPEFQFSKFSSENDIPGDDLPMIMTDLLKRISSEPRVSEGTQPVEPASPERKFRVLSSETSEPEDSDRASVSSDVSYYQPSRDVLDYTAKLFMLRQPPPVVEKPPKEEPLPYSKAIDPYVVGLASIQKDLRENTILQDELKRDVESMDCLKEQWLPSSDCPCDVLEHPKHWTTDIIDDVHDHSFLLDYRDLEVDKEYVFGANSKNTIVFFNVPMVDGHPWKKKAEQVMRFIDVELGVGDQTAYDLFYYKQPCDRKIFLILQSHMVVGLVLAEKQLIAHRILQETMHYRSLEEDPVPVRVGINRLWVHVSMRRHHLGTLLCDFVGRLFYKGESLKREEFAFNCNFSDGGVAFARLYLKTLRVPLYKGKSGIKI